MTMAAEESSFLSGLVAENILNTQEMLKLFQVLANDEQFENTTDLNEVLSELETFSLTELVDKPNFRWIKYPTVSETNTTKIGKQPKVDLLVKRLNSNATKRLMREISIPATVTAKTDILVIYDKNSFKLLSYTDNGLTPTLREYNGSTLPEQLWILDDGALINVASRLSLQRNMSNIVLQKYTNSDRQWYNFRGRLSHRSGNNNCFLDTEHNTSFLSSSSDTTHLGVRCEVQIQDVRLVIASFSDVNTPETLALHQPETVYVDPISKRIGFKFKIFMYLLGYIITSFFEEVPSTGASDKPTLLNQVRLEETFFIKHEQKPCQVLIANSLEDKYHISFGDFAEDMIEYQLWYWKDSQIVNVATQAVLATDYVVNEQDGQEENYAKYFSLWTRENNTIQAFNKQNCELNINDSSENILIINCSRREYGNVKGPWTFVSFDQPNFDNFQEVVCMYFIQTTLWPCEFISTSEMYAPSLTPLTDSIYSQLWYMSNGRLINIDLGLAMTELSGDANTTFIGLENLNSHNLTTWYVIDGQIYPSSNRNTVLTINVSKNGTLSLSPNINAKTQRWKIIDLNKAFESETDLQCADDISITLNPFVIRNKAIQACKLLTVVENTNGFELQMKGFDKSILDFQTWITHRGHLINIASGLTIEPDLDYNDYPMDTFLMLRPVHSFQQKQMWLLDDDGYLRWHSDHFCFINYHFNESNENQETVSMKCEVDHSSNYKWTFTDIPKDDNSPNTLDYMCIYFIKSSQEPCQYITANINDGSLYLRPIVPEFLEKQLWVWSEQTISLVTTGHYFGAYKLNTNMSTSELLLVNPDEENISASWRFDKKKLIETELETHISVDVANDGQLFLSRANGNSGIDLAFVNYNELLKDLGEDTCGLPVTNTSNPFFLRSNIDKCKILTGAGLGKQPTFEHFNEKIFESQLWFYEDKHLINLHSNLVLHLNADISIHGSHVIMQNYYRYANAQKWLVSGEMIFFGNSEICVLDVDKASLELIVWCDGHGGGNQIWEKIEFDDDSKYIDEITCMFFLRHEQVPCELLTHFAHTVSPGLSAHKSRFNNQIWYWSGQHIINAATGLALHGSDTKRVSMGQKTYNTGGEWIINGNQVSLSYKSSLILGLNSESGILQLFDKYRYLYNGHTKWSVIDLEAGINDPSMLSCENIRHSTGYLIKSEKEPCNVLTENAYGDLTLNKAGHEKDNQAWVRVRRHIVSAKTRKALSTSKNTNGATVKTESRFEHKLKQHWTRHGSSIHTKANGRTKFLDSRYDVCIWDQDGSTEQKWTWHDIEDVRKEVKLLRCSKCFDKGEEKANEVMSYIPVLGWLYSLVRAPVYAGKGCDDVAVESLMAFTLDIALDIAFAAVTALTAGTASAVAYGIKTGVKFGFKAGLKAGLRAITTSIKLAVRQGLNFGKTVLKQGLKKTVLNLSKRGFTVIKTSLKSTMNTVKRLPSITKSVVYKTGKSVKTISAKVFNSVRSTTYGSFKSSVKSGLRKIPTALKTRIKKIGNRLADNAERRIKKYNRIKHKKPKSHVRCKRAGSSCFPKQNKKTTYAKTNVPPSAFIKEPTEDVVNNFKHLLKEAKETTDLNGHQNAHFGLTKKSKNKIYFDKDSVRSKKIADVSEYPLDKEYIRIGHDATYKPKTHTEQGLLGDMVHAVRKCKGKCDEFYMWTKNSPCMVNEYTHIGKAKSCFAMLVEFCYNYVKVDHVIKRCNIGFKDFWGFYGKKSANSKLDFETEIAKKTELVKNLAESNTYKIPVSALDKMAEFIRFYQIAT